MIVRKTVAFSRNSSNLFFHILTRCNLRCRHCYINPEQQGKDNVPIKTIKAWLDAFSHESASTNVIFLGGEPTLHPDLHRAIKHARHKGFRSITVDTNGYLFHDILSMVNPQEVDFFSFSLDGATGKTNDEIRGQGSYDTCIKGIRQTVAKGFAASGLVLAATFVAGFLTAALLTGFATLPRGSSPSPPGKNVSIRNRLMVKPAYSSGASPRSRRPSSAI